MLKIPMQQIHGAAGLLLLSSSLLLQACGGGNNADSGTAPATSFTVSTSAGPNGSISPGSVRVDAGEITQFTLTPAAGYVVSAASGCDGGKAR